MFCKRCGQEINDDSVFCRHCGERQNDTGSSGAVSTNPIPKDGATTSMSPARATGYVLAGLLLLIVVANVLNAPSASDNSINTAIDDIALDPGVSDLNLMDSATERPKAANWSYSEDEDKVRGGTTHYARTTSTNSIFQNSPYDSSTTMDLVVRQSPAYGTDVLFIISSGQMMCPSYEGCSGTVRFDDGPAQTVSFNGPEDNSSDTIFVVGAKSFIGKLKNAKKVVVEKTLYEAGSPQFEFDVAGLKWDH